MSEQKLCPVCEKPIPEERGPHAGYCTIACRDKAIKMRQKARKKTGEPPQDGYGGDGTPAGVPDGESAPFPPLPSIYKSTCEAIDRLDLAHDPTNRTRVAMAKNLAAILDDAIGWAAIASHGPAIASNMKELRSLLAELTVGNDGPSEWDSLMEELGSPASTQPPETRW